MSNGYIVHDDRFNIADQLKRVHGNLRMTSETYDLARKVLMSLGDITYIANLTNVHNKSDKRCALLRIVQEESDNSKQYGFDISLGKVIRAFSGQINHQKFLLTEVHLRKEDTSGPLVWKGLSTLEQGIITAEGTAFDAKNNPVYSFSAVQVPPKLGLVLGPMILNHFNGYVY